MQGVTSILLCFVVVISYRTNELTRINFLLSSCGLTSIEGLEDNVYLTISDFECSTPAIVEGANLTYFDVLGEPSRQTGL